MAKLKLISICAYLTDSEAEWRAEDHRATKMVKAMKGDPIKGYFHSVVGGEKRRYDQNNIHEFVSRIPRALATNMLRHHDAPATIVPIPNSHVTTTDAENFKTLELANNVAKYSGGKYVVEPAIVFKTLQKKSRDGGPRDPGHFEAAYNVVKKLNGPIILLDDVCTSGGHIIGAYRRVNTTKSPVALACTFGRTTKMQLDSPIGLRVEELDLD